MHQLTRKIVSIDRPFRFSNGTRTHPAGDYEIITEEQQGAAALRDSLQWNSTKIFLPESAGQIGVSEILEIDPLELEHLLQKQPLD